jgi:hypothetical protein
MKNAKVFVVVSGGNVCDIRSTDPKVEVKVFDMDNLRETNGGDKTDKLYEKEIKKYPHVIA